MLEGLSVVRLLGCLKTLRTAVKPHRYKAVWSAARRRASGSVCGIL